MRTMIFLSLALNIVVLLPVCWGVATGASWASAAYGNASVARGILLAIYLAILFASIVLLLRPLPAAIATLLGLQIAYKAMTPFTVGTLENPVVLSNLAIAAVHAVTLWLLLSRPLP